MFAKIARLLRRENAITPSFDEFAHIRAHQIEALLLQQAELNTFLEVRAQSFKLPAVGNDRNQDFVIIWLYFQPCRLTVENVRRACSLTLLTIHQEPIANPYAGIEIVVATLDRQGHTQEQYFRFYTPWELRDQAAFISLDDSEKKLDDSDQIRYRWYRKLDDIAGVAK